jgi:hypothetical protein
LWICDEKRGLNERFVFSIYVAFLLRFVFKRFQTSLSRELFVVLNFLVQRQKVWSNVKGNVVRFAMKNATQSQTAKRLNAPLATAAQLNEFGGDYYSPELGTTYTLVVKEGKLEAQHRWLGKPHAMHQARRS